jgi:hypothetical protein
MVNVSNDHLKMCNIKLVHQNFSCSSNAYQKCSLAAVSDQPTHISEDSNHSKNRQKRKKKKKKKKKEKNMFEHAMSVEHDDLSINQ